MNHAKPEEQQSAGITLSDVYFVLFRHKYKIILCSLAGLMGAAALFFLKPPTYQSEAKLFIRYVVEGKSLNPTGNESTMRSPDAGGNNIINTEIEILTSLDLAEEVVDMVGPSKILAKVGGGRNREVAAGLVRKNLAVEPPIRSSVIKIEFQHPDKDVVQPVLREVISAYLKKHAQMHQSVGIFAEFLTQETVRLRAQLGKTEQELRKAKQSAGVTSLEDTKAATTEQISKIRQELFNAEAELAEHQAMVKELNKLGPTKTETNNTYLETPAEKIRDYKNVSARLELFTRKEQELLTQYTDQNALVKEVRDKLIETEKQKKKLESDFPDLPRLVLFTPKLGGQQQQANNLVDPTAEIVRVRALESKITLLKSQLQQVRAEASKLDEMEATILELQRKKELEEANLRYFSGNLEQSRIDEALGTGKGSNIGIVQAPSPPLKERPKKFKKMVLGVAAAGVFSGLALAFLLELILDRSIKRPVEIEKKLRMPLFISLPDIRRNGYRKLAKTTGKDLLRLRDKEIDAEQKGLKPSEKRAPREVAPWDHRHVLHRFYEGLRDRLIVFFEIRNLNHKPKLVAVTSCGKGAGVSSIAAGLAASLSETGDGNVLLVDMNIEQGAAQQFHQGRPCCGLDDALENETMNSALVRGNLYLAMEGSTGGDTLPRVLPSRFSHLIPKLKASDYDYIIFDMPPVNQISVTPKLARFMDMVLLVVEAEKTDQEVVKQASAMLLETKTNVGMVLNKRRRYVPRWLEQEL